MMRSESTKALGHPSETKLIFGAAASDMFSNCVMDGRELVLFAQKYKTLSWPLTCYGYACRIT
jgi:hypothetical protein